MVLVLTKLKGKQVRILHGPATVMMMKADIPLRFFLGKVVSKEILSQETCHLIFKEIILRGQV